MLPLQIDSIFIFHQNLHICLYLTYSDHCCCLSFAVEDGSEGNLALPATVEPTLVPKLLFKMLVDMRRNERSQASVRSELEYRVQELEAEIETNKSSMMALQLDFERRRTELESEHDKETSWLVRLHGVCCLQHLCFAAVIMIDIVLLHVFAEVYCIDTYRQSLWWSRDTGSEEL